ncbi:RmlC-like cupin domain-containing protein [Hygrophoropsis aurantiaca]|uniref:RmlC-like cupin domain-containing protein n=1 Tax=Hygrophoropsis aurantiaca TaxID=72124 RepID=A0ACB7ZTY4_9AGAM|nr:RmlC-like cupin domain-containing protein [Hygrophoropsis aurantiaca]
MYSTSHFHSTTHEVLCISSGRARLCFGGEDNPEKVEIEVAKGDVIVVPAGVAHRLLQDLDGGFEMVGSYPKGRNWDMCYGREDEGSKIEEIKNLPWFGKDPIYGDEGPALEVHDR